MSADKSSNPHGLRTLKGTDRARTEELGTGSSDKRAGALKDMASSEFSPLAIHERILSRESHDPR